MDPRDKLERPVRFLARNITSRKVLKYSRVAFAISLATMSFGIASLTFGLVVDMYIYCTIANALPILLPLAIFKCVAHKQWSVRLLKLQNLIALLLVPAAVILDGLILGYLGSIYSLCYGDNSDKCEPKSSNRYTCDTSLPGIASTSDLFCDSRRSQIIGMICAAINLVAFVLFVPYTFVCRRLKSAFARIETVVRGSGRVPQGTVAYPEPIVLAVLGQPISSREAESSVEIAYPADPKAPGPLIPSETVSVQIEMPQN